MSDQHSESAEPADVPADPADVPAQAPALSLDRRKSIIAGIVAVLFLAIVFAKVIPQVGSYSEAVTSLQSMQPVDLVLLIAAVVLYLAIYGFPFMASVPGITYPQGQIVNQSAFTVSNGVPAGGALGLGLQYAQLASYGTKPTVATAGITATGVWSIFLTLGLPVLGVLALVIGGGDATAYLKPGLLGLAILAGMILVFALILASEEKARKVGGFADRVVGSLLHRFRPDTKVDLTESIVKLRSDIVDLVRRRWAAITVAQLAVSLSSALILIVAFHGVRTGSTINNWEIFAAFAISQLGLMVPVTPGGLGTVDAAMISLLVAFGATQGDATAADLLWRAVSYVPQIIIGLICIFYWRVQVRRMRAKEATTDVA